MHCTQWAISLTMPPWELFISQSESVNFVHILGEEGSGIYWAGRKVPNPGSSHPRPSLHHRLYAGTSVPETMVEELDQGKLSSPALCLFVVCPISCSHIQWLCGLLLLGLLTRGNYCVGYFFDFPWIYLLWQDHLSISITLRFLCAAFGPCVQLCHQLNMANERGQEAIKKDLWMYSLLSHTTVSSLSWRFCFFCNVRTGGGRL